MSLLVLTIPLPFKYIQIIYGQAIFKYYYIELHIYIYAVIYQAMHKIAVIRIMRFIAFQFK